MLVIIVLFSNGKKEPNIYREQTTKIYIVNLKNRDYKTESLILKKERNKNVRVPYVKIALVRFVKRND